MPIDYVEGKNPDVEEVPDVEETSMEGNKSIDFLMGPCRTTMIKTEVDDGSYTTTATTNNDYEPPEINNPVDTQENYEVYRESLDMKAETVAPLLKPDISGDETEKDMDIKEEPLDHSVQSEEGYMLIPTPIPMALFRVNRKTAPSTSSSVECVSSETEQCLSYMPSHNRTYHDHTVEMSADTSNMKRLRPWTEDKPHQCTICGYSFWKKAHLVRHIRRHTGEKPFKCRLCEKRFSGCNGFLKHSKTHVGEEPYQCSICEEVFSLKNDMKKHMKSHETGKKLFQCDICYKQFNQSSHVKRHSKTHTGEKPHECGVCGKRFAERSHLKMHQSAHTDDKPYQCLVCSKYFSREDNLKRHTKSHSGVKPYKCDVCGKQFTFTWHLQVHYRTHTGEKPFECSVCGRKFAEKASVKKHMRLHQQ